METEASDRACSAIALAGGQSSRLGQDKSLLIVDGQPLLVRTVETLAILSDDVVVVTNEAGRYRELALPVRLVRDEKRGVGSLMGLYTGLKAARHACALAVACDMPFLSLSLLRYMVSLAPGADVIVPRFADGLLEPLHAVYSQGCLPAIERRLAEGQRRIFSFYEDVRVRYVSEAEIERFDPDHLSFLNVNTLEDWSRVQELLQAGPGQYS